MGLWLILIHSIRCEYHIIPYLTRLRSILTKLYRTKHQQTPDINYSCHISLHPISSPIYICMYVFFIIMYLITDTLILPYHQRTISSPLSYLSHTWFTYHQLCELLLCTVSYLKEPYTLFLRTNNFLQYILYIVAVFRKFY